LTRGRGAFLEHNQNARLASTGAMEQALQAHDAFAAPGTTAEKRHAPGGQASA
jgi:hypothetical protein